MFNREATRYLYDGALKLGYNPQAIHGYDAFRFVKNKQAYYCINFGIGVNNYSVSQILKNKIICNQLLETIGIHVPKEVVVEPGSIIPELSGGQYIVKPYNGTLARDLSLYSNWEEAKLAAQELVVSKHKKILIQEQCFGREYRVIVMKNHAFAAVERSPTSVIGDGKSTIQKLLETEWATPRELIYRYELSTVICKISEYLQEKNRSLDDILPKKEVLTLAIAPNLYQGGWLRKHELASIHESWNTLFAIIENYLGFTMAGIDIIIEKGLEFPVSEQNYWILEINSAPNPIVHKFLEPDFNIRLLSAI